MVDEMKLQLPLAGVTDRLKIKKIELHNFKAHKDISIELSNINILVGINNSGKTNILLGIYSCFEFLKQLYGQHNKLVKGLSKANCDINFFKVPEVREVWYNKKFQTNRKKIPVIFDIEFNDGLKISLSLNRYFGVPHIKIMEVNKVLTPEYIKKLLDSSAVMIPGFIGLLVNEEYSTHAIRNEYLVEGRNSEILRNTLQDLQKDTARYVYLCGLLKRHFKIDLQNIKFEEQTDPYITSEYKEDSTTLDLICSGSGFLQILQLLTYILARKTSIILLDEPDAHLHPQLQRTLISLLYELQTRFDLQIIMSTHSKEIVNNIDPACIIPISKDTNQAKCLSSYLDTVNLINELGSVDNIDLALMLKTKKVLFIEGKTDRIIKEISNIAGYDIFFNRSPFVIIPRGGIDNIQYYEDAVLIRKIIKEDIKVYSVIDGDYRSPQQKEIYVDNSKKYNVNVFPLNKKELENYLLIPDIILKTINEKLTEKDKDNLTLPDIEKMLNDICESLKEELIDNFSTELQRYRKKIGEPNESKITNPLARDIVEKSWNNLEEKLSICEGSQIITEINKKLQEKFVSINAKILLNNLTKENVHGDLNVIFEILNKVK